MTTEGQLVREEAWQPRDGMANLGSEFKCDISERVHREATDCKLLQKRDSKYRRNTMGAVIQKLYF